MFPTFGKSQHFKKHKIPIFTEVCEAEVELPIDVSEIVDFTRVSYSIENQSSIHVLCKNKEGESFVH
jgi:hypothetical protein